MALRINKDELLARLEEVKYEEKPEDSRQKLSRVSLGVALLTLAGITPEDEYNLCCAVVERVLGEVPAPPDFESIQATGENGYRLIEE